MKNKTLYSVGALLATGLAGAATAQFEGPYDPANWTTSNPVGGFISNDGFTLVMTGGDSSIPGNLDYTIMAVATGDWSFNWNYSSTDYGSFDTGGYLLNGSYIVLADNDSQGGGSVTVGVNFGDTIGYRVNTADGIFGAGVLTITKFSGPVPGPATPALLGVAGLLSRRSRRRR